VTHPNPPPAPIPGPGPEPLGWAQLGAIAYWVYTSELDAAARPSWALLPHRERLAWIAAARQVAEALRRHGAPPAEGE
jgi:hypothetical protein